jgi:hypothetical protein
MHGTNSEILAHHGRNFNFPELQRAYAERRIVTYPLTEDKTPAIRGYDRIGAWVSQQLALKFQGALAAGFIAGNRNRLTVIDIDCSDDRLVAEIQGRFGPTPLQVRTPSGGSHLYYRYSGEARRIRPLPDVDILGAGNVVAALSVVPKGRYQIERGSLDDLAALPPMRQERQHGPTGSIPKGQRNQSLFEYCRRTASHCDDLDQLVDAARTWAENHLAEALPPAEVMKTCKSVWTYRGGRKRIMNHIVESEAYATLKTRPYAMALFSILAAENGPTAEFWIADGLVGALGWPRRSIQDGRRTLLELGIVKCVRPAKKGSPALYRWLMHLPDDLPYLVGNPSSPSPLPADPS